MDDFRSIKKHGVDKRGLWAPCLVCRFNSRPAGGRPKTFAMSMPASMDEASERGHGVSRRRGILHPHKAGHFAGGEVAPPFGSGKIGGRALAFVYSQAFPMK